MDVFCTVCETRWDMADTVNVKPAAGASPLDDSQWICTDEGACLERLAVLREEMAAGE